MTALVQATLLRSSPRSIIGYHGCSREAADHIRAEGSFLPSTRAYDWLGEGVYFWEYAPYRALEWAEERSEPHGGEPVVLQATVRLGRCLNLLDIEHIPGLGRIYDSFVETIGESALPRNTERGRIFWTGRSSMPIAGHWRQGRPAPSRRCGVVSPKERRSILDQRSYAKRTRRLRCAILLVSNG